MNNDERVLRLSDLLSILLRNLKSIVCITLVFALLGSAYAFTKAHHSDQSAAVQTQTKNIDEQISTNSDISTLDKKYR